MRKTLLKSTLNSFSSVWSQDNEWHFDKTVSEVLGEKGNEPFQVLGYSKIFSTVKTGFLITDSFPFLSFLFPPSTYSSPSYQRLFSAERHSWIPRSLGSSRFNTNCFLPSKWCSEMAFYLFFCSENCRGRDWEALGLLHPETLSPIWKSQASLSRLFPKQTNAHPRHPVNSNAFTTVHKTMKVDDTFVARTERVDLLSMQLGWRDLGKAMMEAQSSAPASFPRPLHTSLWTSMLLMKQIMFSMAFTSSHLVP